MQRINQEVVEDYAAYRMPADSRVHNVKREGKHSMCESACEQMPPASSNPTASTCVVDGWTVQLDTNSRHRICPRPRVEPTHGARPNDQLTADSVFSTLHYL